MGSLSSVLPKLRLCLVLFLLAPLRWFSRERYLVTHCSIPLGAHSSAFPTMDPRREEAGASSSLDTSVPGALEWRRSFQIRRHRYEGEDTTAILLCDQGPFFLVLFLDVICSHTPLVC